MRLTPEREKEIREMVIECDEELPTCSMVYTCRRCKADKELLAEIDALREAIKLLNTTFFTDSLFNEIDALEKENKTIREQLRNQWPKSSPSQEIPKMNLGNCSYCKALLNVFGDCSQQCEKWFKEFEKWFKDQQWGKPSIPSGVLPSPAKESDKADSPCSVDSILSPTLSWDLSKIDPKEIELILKKLKSPENSLASLSNPEAVRRILK